MNKLRHQGFRYLEVIPDPAGQPTTYVTVTELMDKAAKEGYYPLPVGDAEEIIQELQKRMTPDIHRYFLVQRVEGEKRDDIGMVYSIQRDYVCPMYADLTLITGCDGRQRYVFAQPA
ncbi:MAG TPA: hypothetical protein VFS75_00510 [Candidatus Paceibacterota bacterium]|nr:hypothetical protein [Candidatus Paceibacterota bacterium]